MTLTRVIYPLELREKISYRIQKLYTNLKDRDISLEFSRNVKLDLLKTDVAHRSIIFNGFYELELSRRIARLGIAGGLLIDVGANYGYFSCLWVSKNIQNKAIAFEPSPVNLQHLKHNIRKNAFEDRADIVPIALGKEKNRLRFALKTEDGQTGWGGFSWNDKIKSIDVEVDTLDNYAESNKISKIDVLKIDTEGADVWVLYGARKLLQNKMIKHIYYEQNTLRMKLLDINENEAEFFLGEYDYVVKKFSQNEFYAYPNP